MTETSLRLDKWLWYARFFKTRSRATAFCHDGRLRIGGEIISKANRPVRPGDVLTFPLGRHIRVVKIRFLASRRGPAPEAQALYEYLSPPNPNPGRPPADRPGQQRDPGTGRPTKQERRAMEKLRGDL